MILIFDTLIPSALTPPAFFQLSQDGLGERRLHFVTAMLAFCFMHKGQSSRCVCWPFHLTADARGCKEAGHMATCLCFDSFQVVCLW